MKQYHTKFPTQVGNLKIVHVIDCVQEDGEEDDEFRYQVKLITPEGCGASIGYRSAQIIAFHAPSEKEQETYNRESRKTTTTQSNKPNFDEVDETIATRKKRR